MLNEVLNFWFKEISPTQWFNKDEQLDKQINRRFTEVHNAAKSGELSEWRHSHLGRLAEIIILDQFSRNIFRHTGQAFEQDALALVLAQEAIFNKADKAMTDQQKSFLYMPFMHSESKLIHKQAVRLFSQSGLEYNLEFELKHKVIIDRFGRYPHRNKILNRESTQEELAFLQEPNSSF